MSTGVWTNNWRAWKNVLILGTYRYGLTTLVDMNSNPRTTDDAPNTNTVPHSPMGRYDYPNDGGWPCVMFGSGSATPSVSDYRLDSTVGMSNLALQSYTNVSLTSSGSTVTRTVKYVLQNTSDSATVSVTEWGVYAALNGTRYLLYRELLDSPVTFVPHQSGTLTLTLSMTLDDPVTAS